MNATVIVIVSIVIVVIAIVISLWFMLRYLEALTNIADGFHDMADAIRGKQHEQQEFESKVKTFINAFAPRKDIFANNEEV